MISARYDLSQFIPSFDFFSWLVQVKAAGATEIVFDARAPKADKWPLDVVQRRIASILHPGPALAGLPWREGDDGETHCHPDLSCLVAFCKAGGRLTPLASVLPPGQARYTVTLRRTQRAAERNSNEAAWRRFAGETGAVLIEDHDDAPLHLHDRMALYAGAAMNFFVVSGPAHLCALGGYPCMVFDALKSAATLARNGLAFGEQFPWCGPHQRLIWEPDDYDAIARHFEAWDRERAHAGS